MGAARLKPDTLSALNSLVAESIDIVVHCARDAHGPRVQSVIAVEDLAGGADATQFTVTEVFRRDHEGELAWTGHVPSRLAGHLAATGVDITELLGGGR